MKKFVSVKSTKETNKKKRQKRSANIRRKVFDFYSQFVYAQKEKTVIVSREAAATLQIKIFVKDMDQVLTNENDVTRLPSTRFMSQNKRSFRVKTTLNVLH